MSDLGSIRTGEEKSYDRDNKIEFYLQRSQFELLKNPYVIYDGASPYSVEQKGCPQDAPACIQ